MPSFADLAAQVATAKQQPAARPAAPTTGGEERKAPFWHLSVRIWLPEFGSKLGESMKVDKVKSSGNGRVRFAAAPTAYSDTATAKDGSKGAYLSGALFNFVATDNGFGELATDVLTRITSGEGRLVDVKAQYKPYQYFTDAGEKRTRDEWFIIEINGVDRKAPAADADPQTTEEPAAEEPVVDGYNAVDPGPAAQ